jgi:hypothetical protein
VKNVFVICVKGVMVAKDTNPQRVGVKSIVLQWYVCVN